MSQVRRLDQIPAANKIDPADQFALWQSERTRIARIQDMIDAASAGALAQIVLPTRVSLGIANVDNTSDATKALAGNPVGDAIKALRDSIGISLALTGSLANAIALNAGPILIPAGSWPVTSNLIVPKGVKLRFNTGAQLVISAGVTLTVRGVVEAPAARIFSGSGRVVGIADVRPEWWGAAADGATDDQPALQAAHDCVEQSGGSDGDGPFVHLRGTGANYGLGRQLTLRPTASFNLRFGGGGAVLGSRMTALASFVTDLGPAAVRVQGTTDTIQQIAGYKIGGFSVAPTAGTAALVGFWVGGDGTAGTGLERGLIGTQANEIHDVYIVDGFSFCWRVANCRLIDFNRCSGWSQGRTGVVGLLVTVDANGAFTGDLNFNGCQFVVDTVASTKCVSITHSKSGSAQIKGVRFTNSIFYRGDRTVEIYATGGAIIGDIWFNPGCQLDGFLNTGFYIESNGSTSVIDNINILGTYIRGINTAGINVVSTSSGFVASINIQMNWIASMTNARAIIGGAGTKGLLVNGNTIQDCVSIAQCILINSSRSSVTNNLLSQGFGVTGVADNFISIGAATDWITVGKNNSGGYSTAKIQNLSTGTNNDIS